MIPGILLASLFFFSSSDAAGSEVLKVGSKKFTENVILGDMATFLIRETGPDVSHVRELGGTRILWNALLKGEIHAYPEYTGTLIHEIFAAEGVTTEDGLRRALARHGVRMSAPIGFNNTYAIGTRRDLATKLKLKTISDLVRHPHLRFGFTSEFMERNDGWPGMRRRYGLPQTSVTGLDHDLAYRGLKAESLDVIDFYATDAEIPYYDLVTLEDDRHYFPNYDAVVLYHQNMATAYPKAEAALLRLEGILDASTMASLNKRAKFEQTPSRLVAADFLRERLGMDAEVATRTMMSDLLKNTKAHVFLAGSSVLLAILVAIPLGILSAKNKVLGRVILSTAGLLQTLPSLALLVFMIPLLGIGTVPAMAALFLYGLLPIIRNTYQGLTGIPGHLGETADALGLSPAAKLFQIELPLASRAIFAGIKTAAVINIGTATLGALIGAGGYGQPILAGIRLDNVSLILQGAVPAALLALGTEALFDWVERRTVSRGLRH